MTKNEYIENLSFINKQIESAKQLKSELIEQYIEDNKRFEIGDEVNKIGSVQNGFVFGFEIDYYDNVKPKLYKKKKDGTRSKQQMYVWGSDKLQLVKKATE